MQDWFLPIFGVLSLISCLFYATDKRRARRKKRRVPEKYLLAMGFFGGGAGALLGMLLFRHKTRHWYFWAVNLLGLAVQLTLLLLFWQV